METRVESEGRSRAPRVVSGPPYIGPLWELARDPVALLQRGLAEAGDVAQFRFGPERITLLRHPAHLQRVLVENHHNYGKQNRAYAVLRRLLGQGLFTSEGEFWKRQRRIAQPSFHHQRIAGFATTMAQVTDEMLADWSLRAAEGVELDMNEEMMRLTLRIASLTLLARDPARDAAQVGRALTTLLSLSQQDIASPVRMPSFIPTARNRKFARALRELDDIVYSIIAAQRRGEPQAQHLLGMLMGAVDEQTGEGMSDLQLRDEVMTMFLAGHETTANALTWALWLLTEHPLEHRRLIAEVDMTLSSGAPSLEQLQAMSVLDGVVKETLRLYPPAWLFARSVERDDDVGGYRLRRGEHVFISPYLTHRHPEHWPEPERFVPDRFSAGVRVPGGHRLAYLPFGSGPRVCIGNAFALLELRLILAMIVRRFDFTSDVAGSPGLAPLIALRPRRPIRLRLQERRPS